MRSEVRCLRCLLLFLPVLIAGIAIVACSSDECLGNKNSLPLAGFYSSERTPGEISLDSVSIYGIGAPGDSVLHDSVRSLKESYLPFRIDSDTTVYVIKYLQGMLGRLGIADTITFIYDIRPMFVSTACGAMYDYKVKEIRHTDYIIDSVTCPSGEITNLNTENIKIYFRVSTSDNE